MNPLERVVKLLSEKVEGLTPDRVHMYAYNDTQEMKTPSVICNYQTYRGGGTLGNRVRVAFAISVTVICTRRDNPAQLMINIIKAAESEPNIIDIEGGLSQQIGAESQIEGTPRNSIRLDITLTSR